LALEPVKISWECEEVLWRAREFGVKYSLILPPIHSQSSTRFVAIKAKKTLSIENQVNLGKGKWKNEGSIYGEHEHPPIKSWLHLATLSLHYSNCLATRMCAGFVPYTFRLRFLLNSDTCPHFV